MSKLAPWVLENRRSPVLSRSMTNEKLALAGYYDFPAQYEHLRK
ncbi:hypothetical protein [Paenibacillus agri]|nr:hypothetical protein [Paenibacillus agri]